MIYKSIWIDISYDYYAKKEKSIRVSGSQCGHSRASRRVVAVDTDASRASRYCSRVGIRMLARTDVSRWRYIAVSGARFTLIHYIKQLTVYREPALFLVPCCFMRRPSPIRERPHRHRARSFSLFLSQSVLARLSRVYATGVS